MQKCIGDKETERLEEVRKGVEGGDFPEFFLKPGESGATEKNRGESLEERCAVLHVL